jgi:hypothetical protein
MNKRGSLPNAKHIDFVIESVKKHPDQWAEAYYAAWDAARDASWDVARDVAHYAARDAALYAAWDAVYDATRNAGCGAARNAPYDAILSLVAYDDCEQYLDMSYNELLFMAKLTQIPATILLLPYAKAMELIKEKV